MNQHFELPRRLVDRENLVLELCQHKKVLHLGCIDHPLLDYRIKSGTWLHGKLARVAKELVGIDNAKNEIEYLRNEFGINNILCGDVEKLHEIKISVFDVVLAGEIIEHLSNPGLFLDGVKAFIANGGILIVTTVNAFCLRRMFRIPLGIESVHPDHKCYFSHSTLTSLLTKHGYKIKERYNYRLPKRPPWIPYLLEVASSVISPNLAEGIIYIVEK